MNREYGARNGGGSTGQDFRQGSGMAPPVSVGEEIDVTIEALGEKGDGIAKRRGFVIFVPNTKAGQNVRIKVTKVLKNVGFGEVIGEAQPTSKDEVQGEEGNEGDDSEVFTNQPENKGEELSDDFEETEDFGNDEE